MKKIKIICGTYGSRPGDGSHVVPINRGECCEVTEEEAVRLVSIGVAEYVSNEGVATTSGGENSVGEGTNTPEGNELSMEGVSAQASDLSGLALELDIVDGHFTEEGLSQMTNGNLKKLADDLGLDTSKCKKKDDFVALLLTVELEEETEDDGSVPPKAPGETIVQ